MTLFESSNLMLTMALIQQCMFYIPQIWPKREGENAFGKDKPTGSLDFHTVHLQQNNIISMEHFIDGKFTLIFISWHFDLYNFV